MEEERPQAPFRVAYEVYRDPRDRKPVAQPRKGMNREKQWSSDEDSVPRVLSFGDESPPARSKTYRKLNFFAAEDYSAKDTKNPVAAADKTPRERYEALKKYFEEKAKLLRLRNPLIFFDDVAMRVDIGYGSKEAPHLFPELFGRLRAGHKIRAEDKNDIVFCEDYGHALEVERQKLLKNAEHVIQNDLLPRARVLLDSNVNTEKALIEAMLKASRGLVVGELHSQSCAKDFLIENMRLFSQLGVTQIYMEHLFYERHQALLDEKELSEELKLYLKSLEEGHMDGQGTTYTAVVQAAKECGIRIIAIDSEATYAIGGLEQEHSMPNEDSNTVKRYKAMNFLMLERFRQHDDNNKYLIFVGSGHVSTSQHVPGVSDLLCCANIVIHDVNEEHPAATLERDVDYATDTQDEAHYDFLYYRNPELKEFEQISKRRFSKGL